MPDPIPQSVNFTSSSFNQSIIPQNSTIIIGLSGGPDSIYLLHHLVQLKNELNLNLIAAHLDHEWQESSKIAAKLCQDVCDNLQVDLVIKKLEELKFNVKWNGSKEEIGRKMRRHLFQHLAQKHEAHAIALAHHLQDQQETFFIRLLRGSSLTGLTGMKEHDNLYIRPMLACTKQEILDYLQTHNIAYYTDPTNTSDLYLRNRIRNHVIPALQATDSRFDITLPTTMQHLAQVDDFLEQHTMQILTQIRSNQGIEIKSFLSLHLIVQQRIVLGLIIENQVPFLPTQKFLKEIMRFLEKSTKTKHVIHHLWMIQKNKTHFTIQKTENFNKNL